MYNSISNILIYANKEEETGRDSKTHMIIQLEDETENESPTE